MMSVGLGGRYPIHSEGYTDKNPFTVDVPEPWSGQGQAVPRTLLCCQCVPVESQLWMKKFQPAKVHGPVQLSSLTDNPCTVF